MVSQWFPTGIQVLADVVRDGLHFSGQVPDARKVAISKRFDGSRETMRRWHFFGRRGSVLCICFLNGFADLAFSGKSTGKVAET